VASVWRQWEDGFDLTVTKTGCTATVDGTSHNKLTATIASAADDSDMAEGRVTRSAKLPAGSEGYVRFKLTTPASFSLSNNSSVLIIKAGTLSVCDLYIDSALNVNTFTDTGVLTSGSLNPSAATTLASSTTYTFEVWWKQNQALKVAINGVTKINSTGLSGSTHSAVPTELRYGIDHYDGASATGWTAVHDQGQTGDSFTDSFADPAVPVISVAPVLSGTTVVGQTLTENDGTWTSALAVLSYTRTWKYDGSTTIVGVSGSSYTLSSPDVGHSITTTVIAANSWGSSTGSASNSLGPVTGLTAVELVGAVPI
jgi:hypothetical protein